MSIFTKNFTVRVLWQVRKNGRYTFNGMWFKFTLNYVCRTQVFRLNEVISNIKKNIIIVNFIKSRVLFTYLESATAESQTQLKPSQRNQQTKSNIYRPFGQFLNRHRWISSSQPNRKKETFDVVVLYVTDRCLDLHTILQNQKRCCFTIQVNALNL